MMLHVLVLIIWLLFSQSQATKLWFLPSFQGTILQNDGKHILLAPLTPLTYARTYSLLAHPETGCSDYAEYPTTTCAPSSHAGHCIPLPAEGAITKLRAVYNVTTIQYDWRLSQSQLLSTLAQTILDLPEDSVLLAHGTTCRLATLLNPQQARIVCLSPISSELAREALATGEGLLTLGDAHRYKHPGESNVFKDFRMMEHELGLVSRRRLLPLRDGPWDDRDMFAAPRNARLELVGKLDSVVEFSRERGEEVLGVGDSSLCVQGTGVGVGCSGFVGKVVQADKPFFDLVGLVDVALRDVA